MERRKRAKKPPLAETLLSDEERAVLRELDQSFLIGEDDINKSSMSSTRCTSCLEGCFHVFLDKGAISLAATFFILVMGIVLLVLARTLELPDWVEELSMYVISAGVFGLAGGGTNGIAVIMLLFKIPLLCGSGVFYRRHKQICEVIRMIVLQFLFDSEHLGKYITQRVKQFSSNVRVVDNITQALDSPETEKIIEEKLTILYSQPESYFLEQLGLSKELVKPMIKPSILSLFAESAPHVLDMVAKADSSQALSIPRFREEMNRYLSWRVNELTEKRMGELMRKLIYRHLGWLVVWGCVFGMASGIVTQGVKISLNFNFII